jgi:hypothetical protein
MADKYLLLDANVTAAYYLPRSTSSSKVRERIELLLNSVRSGNYKFFLYIPNFCIAEVFSVFAKHAFGKWNPHVRRIGTIDKRIFRSLSDQFAKDIHNARFIYQYELSRYHILGIDLIAPIDHYYQITRGNTQRHIPMGTFDHLIIAMGVHLAHIHGQDKVVIVSADERLTKVLSRCRTPLSRTIAKKLRLDRAHQVTGKRFSPDIFPSHVNLKTATQSELETAFGEWPLKVSKLPRVYRWTKV